MDKGRVDEGTYKKNYWKVRSDRFRECLLQISRGYEQYTGNTNMSPL